MWPEAAQIRTVNVGGAPARCAVTGSGPPLVLIHGLSGSWRWWRQNVAELSRRHTLYLIDLPGFGSMRAHAGRFSLQVAPEWLRELLQALGLEKVSLAGHSMGGAISLAYAARWPEAVDRLVLVAPAIHLERRSVLANALPALAATPRMKPAFYGTLLSDAIRAGPLTLYRTAKELLELDLSTDLERVRNPVLLIWGRRDAMVPLSIGLRLRQAMPDSRLQVIQGATHVVMFDEPGPFNQAVLRFLAGESVGE